MALGPRPGRTCVVLAHHEEEHRKRVGTLQLASALAWAGTTRAPPEDTPAATAARARAATDFFTDPQPGGMVLSPR